MNEFHRIAILVDGDNISPNQLKEIYSLTSNHGEVVIRKIFGDWSHSNLVGWKSASAEYGFRLEQATAYTSGKNTTDLAIVMAAMDIMYQKLADMVCIASSDGDFTALVQRLREEGIQVIGYGANQTPKSLVNSYTHFITNRLSSSDITPVENKGKEDTPLLRDHSLFLKAFAEAAGYTGEASTREVNNRLLCLFKSFSPKNFGFKKMTQIYEYLGFSIVKGTESTMIKRPTYETYNH